MDERKELLVFCPGCGREHGLGAVTCPHCGAPLPQKLDMPQKAAGPEQPAGAQARPGSAQEGAAEKEAHEAELMQKFEAVLEAERTAPTGRRPSTKAMGALMAVVVLVTGGLGFFLRFKASSTISHSTRTYQYRTPAEPDSRFLAGYAQDELGAGQSALQYASLRGIPGLVQEYVTLYGDYADVWLKDPATGIEYDVSLLKSTTGRGWSVLSMTDM